MAGKILQTPVTVVVPETAPPEKKEQLRELWPDERLTIKVMGQNFDEAHAWALKQQTDSNRILHPFKDPNVAAGQGTLVDDLLTQRPSIKFIAHSSGGGGLHTGMNNRVNEVERSDIQVVAVQAQGSDSLSRSAAAGELRPASNINQRFGGVAVRYVSLDVVQTTRNKNSHTTTVDDGAVDELIKYYAKTHSPSQGSAYEPTTLLAVAALEQLGDLDGEIAVIGTGRNQDPFAA